MVDEETQHVDFLFLVYTGELDAGNDCQSKIKSSAAGFVNAIHCIVVREGNGGESKLFGFIYHLCGGKGAVGCGGMDMQINKLHKTTFFLLSVFENYSPLDVHYSL